MCDYAFTAHQMLVDHQLGDLATLAWHAISVVCGDF